MAWNRSKWNAVLLDILERAGWSAGQVFFATLLAGGTAISLGNLPWKYSLTLAGSAAVASVVLTAVQYLTKLTDLPFWADLAVRAVKTFLSSLLASFAATQVFNVTTFHWTAALNVATVATLTAVGKGLLARSQSAPAPSPGPGEPAAAGQTTVPAPRTTSPSTLTMTTYQQAVGR
jgi:hypothetical protein